jgi:flagellar motility protein MotE (MotC chaperone)
LTTKRRSSSRNVALAGEAAAIVALARGLPKADVARDAGVDVRTIFRWLEADEFRAKVQLERSRLLERAIGRLADHAADAANVLGKLANDDETPPAVRVSAARALLEHAVKLRDSLELEERLAAVEARLEERAA